MVFSGAKSNQENTKKPVTTMATPSFKHPNGMMGVEVPDHFGVSKRVISLGTQNSNLQRVKPVFESCDVTVTSNAISNHLYSIRDLDATADDNCADPDIPRERSWDERGEVESRKGNEKKSSQTKP
jgi:hypothetical protein